MSGRRLEVADLGRRGYAEVLDLQRLLRQRRLDGTLPHDILLLTEHDPVYTLGRGTRESSLPASDATLRATGADVVEVERGGDVTWHGPGQLVGYPILQLADHRRDLHWYLRTLEEALVGTLADLGLAAGTVPGKTGVWCDGRKIASMGIHVRQWVTLHGFALNVDPDLAWFGAIVPCGLHGAEMTSVARELGGTPAPADLAGRARDAVVARMAAAFDLVPVHAAMEGWTADVSIAAKPCDSAAARSTFMPYG